jgi:hypothetical protein
MERWVVLDRLLSLGNLESVRDTSEIHTATVASNFPADATCTELIRHGSV